MENTVKLLLKVLDAPNNKVKWVHFCYVGQNLYNQYLAENDLTTSSFNEIFSRWCQEDFRLDLAMASTKDVRILRAAIKDFYKRAYPDVYLNSETDRQGWSRIWVTKKMKEDLGIYGEERI